MLGEFGDLAQAGIAEEHLDAVGGEGLFVLANDAAFAAFQNREEVVDVEGEPETTALSVPPVTESTGEELHSPPRTKVGAKSSGKGEGFPWPGWTPSGDIPRDP